MTSISAPELQLSGY